MNNIIENICNSCSCNEAEAKEHLDAELRNLRELSDVGDLRNSDIEYACTGLGLDLDYMTYFITQLSC